MCGSGRLGYRSAVGEHLLVPELDKLNHPRLVPVLDQETFVGIEVVGVINLGAGANTPVQKGVIC